MKLKDSKRTNSFNQDSPALQYLVAPANITIFKSPHAKHWMWHPWPFKNIRNRQTNKSFRKSFTNKISALCKTSPTPSGLAVAGPCETMLERPPLPPHRSDERELWSARRWISPPETLDLGIMQQWRSFLYKMTALKLSWMFVPWFQPRHLYISSFRRICSPAHWRPTSLSSGLRMDTPCVQSQEKLGSKQRWMRRG